MKSSRYEFEAVIALAKERGDEFRTVPVDKLVDIVLRRFSNEALLRAITALYRLGFRSCENLAELIPDSRISDSTYLAELTKKASWMVAGKTIIGRMKQLGVIDLHTLRKGFSATNKFLNDVRSERHAQSFALRFILRAKGFRTGIINNSEVTEALKYFEAAYKEEISFDINTFAGFFGSAKFIGAELFDEDGFHSPNLFNEEAERVPWIILPAGEYPFPALVEHFKSVAKKYNREFDESRLERIKSLSPTITYKGLNEFDGYAVFFFNEQDRAILECPFIGNAVYLIQGEWKTLSRLTKRELLEEHPGEVVRVIHSGDWFSKLKEELNQSSRTKQNG